MLLGGLKRLDLGVDGCEEKGGLVGEGCSELEWIKEVVYRGDRGMLSLGVKGNYRVGKFLENLKICMLGESVGGSERVVSLGYRERDGDMGEAERGKGGMDG
ncbi:PLP-dependent aminotransferase family protein [Staphylococcus auricularis]|uniref:hypothetical protein n=1 Tax=Staphylococcus auricularis TaxID=29379 RepID=UPI0012470BE3|nr:hypothetical protein [Staphylococcus auricularis]